MVSALKHVRDISMMPCSSSGCGGPGADCDSRTARFSAKCRRMPAAATHAAPPAWQRRRWSVAARTAHMPCQPGSCGWRAAICKIRV